MRATPHRCFYNPHFDPPTNTFNRKTSSMMRPLNRSRTCLSHHSHSYITPLFKSSSRMIARPRTAGIACSSCQWVSRGITRLKRQSHSSETPEMVFFGMPVGLGLGRDHEPHYGRREGMVLMPYDPLWVGQLAGLRGRTVEPAAGPRGTRCVKAVFL